MTINNYTHLINIWCFPLVCFVYIVQAKQDVYSIELYVLCVCFALMMMMMTMVVMMMMMMVVVVMMSDRW